LQKSPFVSDGRSLLKEGNLVGEALDTMGRRIWEKRCDAKREKKKRTP